MKAFAYTPAFLASPGKMRQRFRDLLWWIKAWADAEAREIVLRYFDAEYYLKTYPDVAHSRMPALAHYLLVGYAERRDPSRIFQTDYYLGRYTDVAAAGVNPLLHYALTGAREGRFPSRKAIFPKCRVSAALSEPGVAEVVRVDNAWPVDAPLVSVIIPCFNYGLYVEEALRSVLSQTLPCLEIIVVDGGSTDPSTVQRLEVLQRQYPEVRFVFRQGRHLAGDNRNFGIRMARGRYICCLDADDLLRPAYLEVAVFLAEAYGYELVYPSVQCFNDSSIEWLLADATFPEIVAENQVSTVALFRKSIWAAVGGYRDWGLGSEHVPEDWDFWVRIVGHGYRTKAIAEPMMLYRVHGSGLTAESQNGRQSQNTAITTANRDLFERPELRRPRCVQVTDPWTNLYRLPAPEGPSLLLALPFITIGGAETLFYALVEGLTRHGYHATILTTQVLPPFLKDESHLFDPLTPAVYHLPRLFQEPGQWRDFVFYLLHRNSSARIVIAGSEFLYYMLPEIRAQFSGIRIVDQLFNDTSHIFNNRYYSEWIDLNIVPSPALAKALMQKHGESSAKIKIIPHGVESDTRAYTDVEQAFSASGLPERSRGKFLVSFFGRLSPEKSPQTFIEIARRLSAYPDIDFCITGEGPERTAVMDLIRRYGLEKRVHAPGFVDDVKPLIAASDVVVVPSSLDGMPLIVLEAQLFCKPVVASSVGGLPDMIADAVTGFICPAGDVGMFCARIEQLHDSPELRRRMGECARTEAQARFGADRMVREYLAAFESLATPDVRRQP